MHVQVGTAHSASRRLLRRGGVPGRSRIRALQRLSVVCPMSDSHAGPDPPGDGR